MVLVMILVLVMVVMLPLPMAMGLVIFGFRKKRKGLRSLKYVATAKSLEVSLRSSQKNSDGKQKWLLLVLSLKKHDR